jgi:hypothetical protein
MYVEENMADPLEKLATKLSKTLPEHAASFWPVNRAKHFTAVTMWLDQSALQDPVM